MTPLEREITDVIVVGGGGSGLSAAIAAAELGVRVILLEKNPRVGGSTGMSVGSFSAAGTSMQATHGGRDSADRFIDDIRVMNGDLEPSENVRLREILVGGATESFERLRRLGVQFIGPIDQPPFTASRLHQVVPNSRAYVGALRAEAVRKGVDIRLGARATALIRNDAGRVIGVRAGAEMIARRSVILASGDYSASRELIARYAASAVGLPPVNPSNTGDGLVMAMEVGAAIRNMSRVLEDLRFVPPKGVDIARAMPSSPLASRAMRIAIERLPRWVLGWFARRALTSWVAPSKALFAEGAILINARGERFADELGAPVRALGSQPDSLAYVLMDSAIADQFRRGGQPISTFPGVAYAYLEDYMSIRGDVTHVAASPELLARQLDVAPATLSGTLDRYNAAVDAGDDRDFGRRSLGPRLQRAPFIALGPLLGRVVLTDGGLAIDERCRVLDGANAPIAGLYAAGSAGQGGLLLKGHGLHLAWAMTSGRIAGQAAAAEPCRSGAA